MLTRIGQKLCQELSRRMPEVIGENREIAVDMLFLQQMSRLLKEFQADEEIKTIF